MSNSSVALILGSGPRVGAAVAQSFARAGYKVVVASRKGTGAKTAEGCLSLQADFANPESIPALFEAVKTEFEVSPSVVVYNAAGLTPPPDDKEIFSIPSQKVASDLHINTISPYVAAQEAVKAWASLSKDTKKTFIYTGNMLNNAVLPVPMMLNLGMGKAASAYWVGVADMTHASQGIRFFYADERHENGKIKGAELDGPAHADFYLKLASHEGNIPWDATFVKGKGFVKF